MYDAAGRLTSACDDADCVGSGFDRVDYAYDGEGHRTAITETPSAGSPVETTFRYQGDAIVAEERDGDPYREYLVDEAGTIVRVVIPPGEAEDGSYLVTWNGHGDALALWRIESNGSLTLANSYTYSTWGTPTTATHNGIADLGFRFLYVGAHDVQWDDAYGLGLHYMHARHYSPSLGRFLQPDPSRLDERLFVYAGNGPVSRVDPSGTIPCLVPVVGWSICAIVLQTIITAIVWAPRVAPALAAVGITSIKFGPRISLSLGRLTHILGNHSGNLSRAALRTRDAQRWTAPGSSVKEAVTKFLSNWRIPELIQATLRSPTHVRTLANGRVEYAKRFPTAAGVDGYGNLQYYVRVIVDRNGKVISAYPASRAFRP